MLRRRGRAPPGRRRAGAGAGRAGGARRGILLWVVGLASFVVGALILVGRSSIMGEEVEITSVASVHFSGGATEAEARRLGEVLREIGFFDGQRGRDVLLAREPDAGVVVSFVVRSEGWNDPELRASFESMGRLLADRVFGEAFTLRLRDEHLNTRADIPVPAAPGDSVAAREES